jgi:hypothetical protein
MKPPPQKPDPAHQWRDTDTPGIQINGNGHRRTKDHKPQTAEKPWPKKPEPAVTEGSLHDWSDYWC